MTVVPTPLPQHASHRHQLLLAALLGVVLGGVAVALLFQYDVFSSSSSATAVQGSGVATSQSRKLPVFTSVELAGSNVVTIKAGKKQSVVVHADDNLLGRVTTQVQDGRLVIGNTSGSFATKSPMQVDIGMHSLNALRLSGSGVVVASDIKTSNLTVTLGGSGVLRASGTTNRLHVTLAGSGDAQLQQLVAADVRAIVAGSGRDPGDGNGEARRLRAR